MLRKKYADIKSHLGRKEFTILTGARQTGKSTLLKQLADETGKSESIAFLNLERKNILQELNENPENIFRYTSDPERKTYFFIDEIQYLADPTYFLKLLYDEYADRVKIIATGSSAFYIDRNFKDSLAGRKKIFEMQTLDFEEFLYFKGEDKLQKELIRIRMDDKANTVLSDLLDVMFEEYLIYGGYPAVVLEKDHKLKIEILEDIKYSFIKRDISDSGVLDDTKFYRLMTLLAGQTGNMVNVHELSGTLSLASSTVENYLYIMQKCYHIALVKPFFQNMRKELTKMPKIYFHDSGLRNSFINNFTSLAVRPDKGQVTESYVFRRLLEKYAKDYIKYWRTADGNEVDFIIDQKHDEGLAYEVKYSKVEFKESKYKKFREHYPSYPLQVLSLVDPNVKNALIRF